MLTDLKVSRIKSISWALNLQLTGFLTLMSYLMKIMAFLLISLVSIVSHLMLKANYMGKS